MKKFTVTLLLLLSTHLIANELSWVDEQIAAIKPPREGISNQEIEKVKDPFIFFLKKKDKKKKEVIVKAKAPYKKHYRRSRKTTTSHRLKLEAILNKSALINGKWYKEGAKVYSYRLSKVKLKSVLLTKNKKTIILSTVSKNKNLKINNK